MPLRGETSSDGCESHHPSYAAGAERGAPERKVGCNLAALFRIPQARWLRALLFGIAYFTCAEVSWILADRDGTFVSIWLPSGLFVACLLKTETAAWPSLIFAGFMANTLFDGSHGSTVAIALFYALTNSMQAAAGAALTRRFVTRNVVLTSIPEFLGTFGFCAVLGPLVVSSLGGWILHDADPHVSVVMAWVITATGNTMAVLSVAPFILAWFSPSEPKDRWWNEPARLLEAVAVAAGMVTLTWYLLVRGPGIADSDMSLLMPFVLWAALRFGVRGASTMNLLLSVLAVYFVSHYPHGLSPDQIASGAFVPTLYWFLVVSALVGLIPAIATEESEQLVLELGTSEERFRNLAAAANEGVVISESGRILDVNDQILSMFGYKREELIGRSLVDYVSAADRAKVSESADNNLESTYELRLVRKDGSTFESETRAKMLLMGDRNLRMTAIRDVTERKQAEALLNGQYQVLEMIATGQPLVATLEALIRVVESQPGGLIGSVLLKEGPLLRHLSAPSLPASYNQAIDGMLIGEGQGCCGTAAQRAQPVFVADIAADPLWSRFADLALRHGLKSCWSTPIVDAKQRVLGTFALYSRVVSMPTQRNRQLMDLATHTCSVAIGRHQDEAALKLSDLSVQRASTPTYWISRDARILKVNRAACEMLGYSEEELLSKVVLDLDPNFTPVAWEARWAGARDNKRLHLATQHRHRDGHLIEVEVDVNWFEFEGIEYHFVFAHDITERLQLEEKLRQSQKMEAIGLLSGGIAHDFNNLLTVIQGHLGFIRIGGDVPAGVSESLEQIGQAASRAANLTEQLLAFGRKQMMRMQDVELNEVVDGFSKMLLRVIGELVEVRIELAPDRLAVSADQSMLEQVMLNLCLNARDAMPKGGRLLISTSRARVSAEDAQRMPSGREGDFARLTVSDTGTGIAPENLERLFEPFFTTKEVGKGTGLGLASVYGILQQHQGWVTVHSELGRGTTFAAYLPLLAAPTAPPQKPASAVEVARGNGTILLVEDDPAVRKVANRALVQMGYQVKVAGDGNEAREIWGRDQSEIRLLLTDMVMPGGLGGADIARMFKADKPGLKVIYMSGYSADLAGTDFIRSGGDVFLGKPFELSELASALRQCLT